MFCGVFCVPRRPGKQRSIFSPHSVKYKTKNRSECPLLSACWDQDWDEVRRRCRTHPREAFCKTPDSGRTALHLACMPGARALEDVIETLIDCNPHAILMHDRHKRSGTPLHFLCGSIHRDNPKLMAKAMQAALEMTEQYPSDVPLSQYWSPFYMACSKSAPPDTLATVLQSADTWIAPYTGCEVRAYHGHEHCTPLAILWSGVKEHLRPLEQRTVEYIRAVIATSSPVPAEHALATESWLKLSVLLQWGAAYNSFNSMAELLVLIIQPVPELLRLVCTIFPETLLTRAKDDITVLQALLNRTDLQRVEQSLIPEMLLIIVESCPELLSIKEKWSGLYPVMRAASLDLPLDCVYGMLIPAPHLILRQR